MRNYKHKIIVLNRKEINFAKSETLEYIFPAGPVPSRNLGASKTRPSYVRIQPAAVDGAVGERDRIVLLGLCAAS